MFENKSKYTNYVFLIGLIFFTCLVYYKSIHFEFINWDDDRQVYENQDIRTLNTEGIKKMFSSYYLQMYQPLTTLSFATEFHFFGINPRAYHIHNLLLHLLNTLLVFLFINLLTRHGFMSFIAAGLFSLHPMHVESVAWITERKDVLYAFFYLLSLVAYIRYLRNGRNIFNLLLTLVLFILALLSKSASVTLPVILFLIDFFESRKLTVRSVTEKIPFLLLSVVFGIISIKSQNIFDPTIEITQQFTFIERILIGCFAYFLYVFKLFFPVALSAIYPFPVKTSHILPFYYFVFPAIMAVLIYLLIRYYNNLTSTFRYFKLFLFGFLFYTFTIGLVLFLPAGSAFAAERYTYLPYIGLSLMIISGILHFKEQKKTLYTLKIMLIAWLLVLAFLTFQRLNVWKNSLVFWDDVVSKNPHNAPMAYQNRGVTLYRLGNFKGAITDFTRAIQLHPKFKDAYYYRALSRFYLNDFARSVYDFDTTLILEPGNSDVLINRGQAYANMGNLEMALSDFSNALTLNPADYLPWYNRGIILSIMGKQLEAVSDFRQAIRINPNFAAAWYAKGTTEQNLGNINQACADFSKASQLGNEAATAILQKVCR